jgi:molybdenum cofactor biosynthesis protein B
MVKLSKSVKKHREKAIKKINFVIFTISSTLYNKKIKGEKINDESGSKAIKLIEKAGYNVIKKIILPNDIGLLREEIDSCIKEFFPDVIITIGGTGLSPRDVTIEAITPIFEKSIPGFGELFRLHSFKEIGTASFLSRASAGIYKGVAIFSLPGSPHAIEIALKRIILPEIGHLVAHLKEKI